MSDIPRHLNDREQWSAGDFDHYQRTGELPPNPEWVKRKAGALADAGLESDGDQPTAIDEMSAAQHASRKYGDRR